MKSIASFLRMPGRFLGEALFVIVLMACHAIVEGFAEYFHLSERWWVQDSLEILGACAVVSTAIIACGEAIILLVLVIREVYEVGAQAWKKP